MSGLDQWPRPSDIVNMRTTNESLHLNRIINLPSEANSLSVHSKTTPVLNQPKLGPLEDDQTASQLDGPELKAKDIPDLTTDANGLVNLLLHDVTFDHLLPTSTLSSGESANYTSTTHALPQALPKLAHRALIRPDQVHRLFYLSPARRQVCQDQVDALYYILKSDDSKSAKMKARQAAALKDLESLSHTLLNDIRNWRRTANLVPELPFSI